MWLRDEQTEKENQRKRPCLGKESAEIWTTTRGLIRRRLLHLNHQSVAPSRNSRIHYEVCKAECTGSNTRRAWLNMLNRRRIKQKNENALTLVANSPQEISRKRTARHLQPQ